MAQAVLGAGDGPKVAEMRIKRSDAASRRFLGAAKTLATVRRLMAGVKITVEHSVRPDGRDDGEIEARSSAARNRISAFVPEAPIVEPKIAEAATAG